MFVGTSLTSLRIFVASNLIVSLLFFKKKSSFIPHWRIVYQKCRCFQADASYLVSIYKAIHYLENFLCSSILLHLQVIFAMW